MEIEIGFDIGLGVGPRTAHHGEGLPQAGQMLLLDAGGRQGGDLRLENRAYFRQVQGTLRLANLDHPVKRLPDVFGGAVGDEGSAAGVGFEQSLFPERLDRLADRGPADPKLLGQFSFRR